MRQLWSALLLLHTLPFCLISAKASSWVLQLARKPSDAQPAPKQPKASSAPKPAPKAVGFFVGRSVLYICGDGAMVRANVVKNHGNGKYDIQFQQDGNDVVRFSLPRAKLRIA